MKTPPVGSKTPLLTQLQHVYKASKKKPLQLEQYEKLKPPVELDYIYRYWQDFYNGDQFSYTELQAWQQFMGVKLEYREAELIRQLSLERAVFDSNRLQQKIEQDKTNSESKRGRR